MGKGRWARDDFHLPAARMSHSAVYGCADHPVHHEGPRPTHCIVKFTPQSLRILLVWFVSHSVFVRVSTLDMIPIRLILEDHVTQPSPPQLTISTPLTAGAYKL